MKRNGRGALRGLGKHEVIPWDGASMGWVRESREGRTHANENGQAIHGVTQLLSDRHQRSTWGCHVNQCDGVVANCLATWKLL